MGKGGNLPMANPQDSEGPTNIARPHHRPLRPLEAAAIFQEAI